MKISILEIYFVLLDIFIFVASFPGIFPHLSGRVYLFAFACTQILIILILTIEKRNRRKEKKPKSIKANYEAIEAVMPLYEDIKEMKKYKDVLRNSRHSNSVHFELHEHYGSNRIWMAKIPSRYTNRFISLLDQVIKEAEKELSEAIAEGRSYL